jgi:hypothetical protein
MSVARTRYARAIDHHPLALSASRVRFERARFDRRAAARPINPRLQKVPDFFFSRAAS